MWAFLDVIYSSQGVSVYLFIYLFITVINLMA